MFGIKIIKSFVIYVKIIIVWYNNVFTEFIRDSKVIKPFVKEGLLEMNSERHSGKFNEILRHFVLHRTPYFIPLINSPSHII